MLRLSNVIISKISGIYKTECKDEYVAIHQDRPQNTIIICLEGRVCIRQGRRVRYVDENNVGLISSDSKYRLYTDANTKLIFIEFFGEGFDVKKPEIAALTNKDLVKDLAVKLEELWSKRFFNYQLTAMVDIYTILNDISYGLEKAHYDAKKLDIIENALRHIENNYNDYNISNEQLANLCGISVVYFRKLFTAAFKIPPMRYVQELRMKKAKELLGSGYYTVTEIAEMTGYSSIYSFSKTFKAVNGTSPNTFRSKRK